MFLNKIHHRKVCHVGGPDTSGKSSKHHNECFLLFLFSFYDFNISHKVLLDSFWPLGKGKLFDSH